MTAESSTPAQAGFNDQRIEVIIGALLRTGVLLAAVVIIAGGVLYLLRNGHTVTDYKTFHGEPGRLKSISDIVHGAVEFEPRAIIQLGLLLLIATPVARVVFSAVAFGIERDYMYVVITLIVLGILLYSLLGSS